MELISQAISEAFAKFELQVQSHDPSVTPRIFIHVSRHHSTGKPITIEYQISKAGCYGSDECATKGKCFWDVAEEFMRRMGFAESQENILLSPPVIEEKPIIDLGDEVPF